MLGYQPNLYTMTMCNCKTVQPCVTNLYLSSFTISHLLTFYIWFHFLRYLFNYQCFTFSDICDPNGCFKLKGPSCPWELYSDSVQVCAFLQLSSSSKQVLQIPKIVQLQQAIRIDLWKTHSARVTGSGGYPLFYFIFLGLALAQWFDMMQTENKTAVCTQGFQIFY